MILCSNGPSILMTMKNRSMNSIVRKMNSESPILGKKILAEPGIKPGFSYSLVLYATNWAAQSRPLWK